MAAAETLFGSISVAASTQINTRLSTERPWGAVSFLATRETSRANHANRATESFLKMAFCLPGILTCLVAGPIYLAATSDMLCCVCKEKEATVHLTQIAGD